MTELDPGADLLSSRVLDPSDKWEEYDDFGFCLFDEMPLEFYDHDVMFSSPIDFVGPLLILLTMLKMFLGDIHHLNTYILQSHLIVTMQLRFVLS